MPFIPVALAERGIVAIERDDWNEAEALSTQALAIMQDGSFDDYWTSALVYAWAAHVASQRGDAEAARDLAGRAGRLRPLLTHALPIVSVQSLLELARAYIAVGDTWRSTRRPAADPRHPSASAVTRRPAGSGRLELLSKLESAQRRDVGRLVAHHGRATTASRSCPPISRWRRSASGCSSHGTPSSPRRSRSTASSVCRAAARRSAACTSSAWSPTSRTAATTICRRSVIQSG